MRIQNYFFPCLFFFFLVSCSKKDQTPNDVTVPPNIPVKNCRIVEALLTSGTGDTVGKYTYSYNSDGKLAGTLYSGAYADTPSYTYNGNTIYRSVAAGVNSSVDTIKLNDAGFMVQDEEVVGPTTYFNNYVYDANQQLQNWTNLAGNVPLSYTTYTFVNGDNTLVTEGTFQDTLSYDESKLAVGGNIDQFNQFLYLGAYWIKNKHLLISERHGSTTTYSYVYNADGNIASVKMLTGNGNSEIITYTYNCN